MTKLRQYQLEGARAIRDFGGRALLADEQGLGKTIQTGYFIHKAQRLRPVVVICPSSVKWNWKYELQNHFGLDANVIEGHRKPRTKELPGEINIINYDILKHAKQSRSWLPVILKARPQILVMDECFPENVKVLTDRGPITIGEVVEKRLHVLVLSMSKDGQLQWKRINQYIKLARKRNLVRVIHETGSFVCTENHEIWTEEQGYVEARLLQNQKLRVVWKGNYQQTDKVLFNELQRKVEGQVFGVLEKKLPGSREESKNLRIQNRKTKSRSIAVDVQKQPHEESKSPFKIAGNQNKERDLVNMERSEGRKWSIDQGTDTPPRPIRQGLDFGIGYSHWEEKGISMGLQSGHWEPDFKNSDRGRWNLSPDQRRDQVGQEEVGYVRVLGVESVEVDQQGNFKEPKVGRINGDFVYCLEVEKNHNFFADGVLVSNCQYIKNPAAKRTKAVLKIAEYSRARIGLSGTPIENNVIDLFPILQAIKPELFPSFTKFAWRYTKPKYTPWGWTYTGSAHAKELNRILLENLMIRRLKSDVAKELPDKIYKTVLLKLTPEAQAEYDKASKDFMGWLRSKSPARANRAKKSQALTKIGYLVRLAAKLKHKSVLQWIRDFHESHPDQKLVGMTMHTPCVESLMRNFSGSVKIDGTITGKLRHDTVRRFQTQPKVKNLWGQWKAASVGITLTAASNFAALDLPWSPSTYKQGPDRIHRIGQTKHCIIHLLIALGTIEEKLVKVLRDKGKIQDSVVDGKESSEDVDFLEDLLKEFKK